MPHNAAPGLPWAAIPGRPRARAAVPADLWPGSAGRPHVRWEAIRARQPRPPPAAQLPTRLESRSWSRPRNAQSPGAGAALRTTRPRRAQLAGRPQDPSQTWRSSPSILPASGGGGEEAEGAGVPIPERRLDPAWAGGGHDSPRVRRMLGVLRAVLGVLGAVLGVVRAVLGVLRAVLGVVRPTASRPVQGGIVSGPPPPALAPPRPPPTPAPAPRSPPPPAPPALQHVGCVPRPSRATGCVLTRRHGPLGGAAVCEQRCVSSETGCCAGGYKHKDNFQNDAHVQEVAKFAVAEVGARLGCVCSWGVLVVAWQLSTAWSGAGWEGEGRTDRLGEDRQRSLPGTLVTCISREDESMRLTAYVFKASCHSCLRW